LTGKTGGANFVERRGTIPGGCPLLNTAIDTDDGNSSCAGALASVAWLARYYFGDSVPESKRGKSALKVDAKKLATLMISFLEGAVMVYRLERNEDALRAVQAHLDSYLETEVRVPSK